MRLSTVTSQGNAETSPVKSVRANLREGIEAVAKRNEALVKALDDLVVVKVRLQTGRRNSKESRTD